MEMDYEARAAVQGELEPGESLLWVGRPNPMRAIGPAWGAFVFGIPWTAFALFWTWGASGFGRHMPGTGGPFSFFPLFGLPFILVGLGMLTSPLWAYRKGKRTLYAITNNRLVIIATGWTRTVQSYTGDDIGNIERVDRADGTGDVIFARQEYHSRRGYNQSSLAPVGFLGIPAARSVEKLIRDTFKSEG